MTDKKEAVSLKINQINLELDSLINRRLYAEGTTPLNCGSDYGPVFVSFTNKFQPSRKSGNETIHVLCLELGDNGRVPAYV